MAPERTFAVSSASMVAMVDSAMPYSVMPALRVGGLRPKALLDAKGPQVSCETPGTPCRSKLSILSCIGVLGGIVSSDLAVLLCKM